MDRLRASMSSGPLARLLDFEGINALEVLLSPLYLSVLNTLRQGKAGGQPSAQAMLAKARLQLYRVKTAWRDRQAVRKSASCDTTDIVLWSRDITHTVILHPVAQALRGQGARCKLLACQPNAFEGLYDRDAAAIYTRSLWPEVVHEAQREGTRRAQAVAAHTQWDLPEFPGHPDAPLAMAIRQTLAECLPLASEAIANARAVFDRLEAKVLVVGNDLTMEGRAGCLVAAERVKPSAMFMHGSITGDAMQGYHRADRILVYGNVHRQELIERGLAPERIVVCGAPNLDQRPKQTGDIHPQLQARLGLKPGDPWILVATSGPGHRISHHHHETVIRHLVDLCLAFPEVPVVVKLHRKDRLEYYQQGLKDCEAARLVIVAETAHGFPKKIFEWLQGCRVVLTGASAVAVEAMLMDVPVVTMDFCDEIHNVDFIDAGATTHVRTPAELIETVRQTLAGQSPPELAGRAQAYLRNSFFALDGRSAVRGAQTLMDLATGH